MAVLVTLVGMAWMILTEPPMMNPSRRNNSRVRCMPRHHHSRKRVRQEAFEPTTPPTTPTPTKNEAPPTEKQQAKTEQTPIVEDEEEDQGWTQDVVADHSTVLVRSRPPSPSSASKQIMERTRHPVSAAKRLFRIPLVPVSSGYRDHTGRNSTYAHLR